jgi:hypothetical protein
VYEREQPQPFDVLAVGAFWKDSIALRLLTRAVLAIRRRQLAEEAGIQMVAAATSTADALRAVVASPSSWTPRSRLG